MKTEITFYAGIHTIGGVVMSVVYGDHRVILEIGTAYQPKTDVYDNYVRPRNEGRLYDELRLGRAPRVDGIYDRVHIRDLRNLEAAEDSKLHTAVFVSHLHLDHMSCMGYLSERVDVYLSDSARCIETALETVGLGNCNLRKVPYKPMYDMEPVMVGEIKVVPFLLCRQSYQDWSFYVETPDVKLHYTGDLMMHGVYKDAVLNEMNWVAAQDPDILVCEATTFMDSTMKMVYGTPNATVEPDVEMPEGMLDKCGLDLEMEKILRQQKGLAVLNFYQREMADVESFDKIAANCGRTLVLEPETGYVAWKFFKRPIPIFVPDDKRFLPNGELGRTEWYQELMAANPRVTREELFAAPEKYLLQNSYEYVLGLFDLPDQGAAYLHAGGIPIGAYDPKYANLMRILEHTGFTYSTFFAKNYFSHAYPCQVKYYVDSIDARVLIPSHSEEPERLLPGPNGVQFIPELGVTYTYEDGKMEEVSRK